MQRFRLQLMRWVDSEGEGQGVRTSPKWLKVTFEILVQTPLKKQLDPMGPMTSQGRFVQLSMKHLAGQKEKEKRQELSGL